MRKFKILVAGQLISSIGSGLTDFGLAVYVLALTGSVTAASVVSIAAFLPFLLLAPVGGVLADHYDRRIMMMLGELLSGLGLVICLFSVMSRNPSLVAICIGVGISSVFKALMEPAFKATVTDLLSEEDFAKAGGMIQIAANAKLLISPAIAGLLLQIAAVSTLIFIDILTFFTTAATIAIVKKGISVKTRECSDLRFRDEMRDGIAAVRGNRGIPALIALMTFAVFCLGFIQILSKPLILSFSGETELGILTTISAFGMLAGSALVSLIKNPKSYVRMLSCGLFGCGVFFSLMGVRENLILIAASGFLMFAFMPAIQIGAEVLIRKNLENNVQGRAFGLIGFITQMGYIFAYLLSGILADYFFKPSVLILIAGFALAITGIAASRMNNVKLLELENR